LQFTPFNIMKVYACFIALSLASGFSCSAQTAQPEPAGSPDAMRTFYFGNSLTQSSRPEMHAELAETAGKDWTTAAFLGAGWQSWQHRNELFRAIGRPLGDSVQSLAARGDLTIDLEPGATPAFHLRPYLSEDWDAILIQIFGSAKDQAVSEKWGQNFDEPINVGDVVAASDLIHHFLKKNPEGEVFIYTVWPPMEPGTVPPDEQLPEWAKEMKAKKGKIRTAEFPDREGFNYAEHWASPYLGDHEKPWTLADYPHWRTRDYSEQVFEGIKENFPDLWKSGRLHHLPGGELFFRLNEKMEAGEFPGIDSITEFYTDVQHVRAGAADYSVAALFYTGFFGEKPDDLNYAIYNEQARYGEDGSHDFGEVLEITPERAAIINETVWELLQEHPQANLNLE